MALSATTDKGDKSKFKAAFDSRSLPFLRQQLQVNDADWEVLLPRITKVQTLAKELYDLRNPQKGFASTKISKPPKDGLTNAAAAPSGKNAQLLLDTPFYLVDFAEKARQLKSVMADPSARAADIRWRLAAFRAARATAEQQLIEDLTKARADLTELLTSRQELICVMNGLLE